MARRLETLHIRSIMYKFDSAALAKTILAQGSLDFVTRGAGAPTLTWSTPATGTLSFAAPLSASEELLCILSSLQTNFLPGIKLLSRGCFPSLAWTLEGEATSGRKYLEIAALDTEVALQSALAELDTNGLVDLPGESTGTGLTVTSDGFDHVREWKHDGTYWDLRAFKLILHIFPIDKELEPL